MRYNAFHILACAWHVASMQQVAVVVVVVMMAMIFISHT